MLLRFGHEEHELGAVVTGGALRWADAELRVATAAARRTASSAARRALVRGFGRGVVAQRQPVSVPLRVEERGPAASR